MQLFVVIKASDSLEAEMTKRKQSIKTGRTIGLTACILTLISFLSFMSFVSRAVPYNKSIYGKMG
jgi:hypothetical protein